MEIVGYIAAIAFGLFFLIASSVLFVLAFCFKDDRFVFLLVSFVYAVISGFLLHGAWVYVPFKVVAA